MTQQQAIEILAEMAANSREGDAICDEVIVENGEVTAYGMRCDRENCHCLGGWWNGDKRELSQNAHQYNIEVLEKIAGQ